MRYFSLLCIAVLSYAHSFAYQHIDSCVLFKTITRQEFQATIKKRHLPKSMVPAHYTVDVYDITYYTKWHDGSTIKASGLYFVPRNAKKPMPELIYHHGTRMSKGRSPRLGGEESMCLGMAMDGYAVLMPDYIGLGHGDKFHIYQEAESIGQASVDMLFATRELNDSLKLKTNGMLFLTGYSEGGYATLATQKLMQDKYPGQFHVTASSPMSGAYDMCGAQGKVMFKNYSRPHYLPYLLRGYNEVYHFVPDINKIYKHPYDSSIARYFDEKHSMDQIDNVLPHIPKDMLLDTFVNLFVNDPTFPLNVELKENSLCDWKPDAPVQLCYCDSDEQVMPENARIAYKTMRSNGAQHITLRRAGSDFSHTRCAVISILYTKMYFDTFLHGSKYGGKGAPGKRLMADVAKLIVKKSAKKGKHGGDEHEHHHDKTS
jgi:hypothetical protein